MAIAIFVAARGLKEMKVMAARVKKRMKEVLMDIAETGAREGERIIKEDKYRGNPIHVRSGRLRGSVHTKTFPKRLEAIVGTNVIYAKTLEEGATITPKRARLLTIPLKAALTRTGQTRGSAREVTKNWWDSWWQKTRSGKIILFGLKTDASRKPVPLFWGVRKVTIKARHVFRDTLETIRPGVLRDAKNRIDVMLEKESHRAE